MKLSHLIVLPLCWLCCACAFHRDTSGGSPEAKLAATAETQHQSARKLANSYLNCIEDIDHKTPLNSSTTANTRREVILESCHETYQHISIILEQAYDNDCHARGSHLSSSVCDDEAVRKAAQDMLKLAAQAKQLIQRREATRGKSRSNGL